MAGTSHNLDRRLLDGQVTTVEALGDAYSALMDKGVDLIETNTYGANRLKLESHGFGDSVGAINQRGVTLAREAAGGEAAPAGRDTGLRPDLHDRETI